MMTVTDFADMFYALLLAIVLVFAVKYFSAIFQAWAHRSNDMRYSALAERALAAQSETQAALAGIQADLSKIASSVAAVEKVLQQVD
jgi:steroid 5-alpha reductase family enzyme